MDEVEKNFSDHLKTAEATMKACALPIKKAAEVMVNCYNNNGIVLACGNGGSAADAQHFAGEFVGRFRRERKALAAIALPANSSVITALGNDYSYDYVFERQVEAFGKKENVLLAISTSGNSGNVIAAVKKAKSLGMKTIGLLGKNGGKMRGLCDVEIIVPSEDTQRIQEMHLMIIHSICEIVEKQLFG